MNQSARSAGLSTRTRRGRRLWIGVTVAIVALAVCRGRELAAQSLMVGADGTVHLDGLAGEESDAPVIIQSSPELVPPGLAPQLHAAGLASQPSITAALQSADACSVPFVPCLPMSAALAGQPAQPLPIKFGFFGEFLFLQPSGADVSHAQQLTDATAGAMPIGGMAATDLHYEPGVRIGGDMAVSPTNSIAASYTWYESNARSSLGPPALAGGAGAVGSLVHPPGLGILGSTGTVDARSVLDFQMADFQYRSRLLQGSRHWVNGGLGLRWAHLEQDFGQTGEFGGASPGLLVTQTDVDFDGGGALVAVDGGRTLGDRGFSVYARSTLSPVMGQFHAHYRLANDTTGETLAQVAWKDDRVMTILDYELGLAWVGPRRRWRLAAGYTQSFWFNAVTMGDFIGSVQSGQASGASDTIVFDGLVARIEHFW